MEIVFDITFRLLFLLIVQLLWDMLIHKDYKNIDVRIEEAIEENDRLFKECYENGHCDKYCTLNNRCKYKIKERKTING